ncbi:hypothetical protein Tco_1119998, partial [Tanacetum coccineum]
SSLISLSRGSFDVIVGMDWLSKRKFVIVCHEKVVRIPLEGDEILRVHGERTQGVVKTSMNKKVDEPKLSDNSVVRDFIDVFSEDLSMTTTITTNVADDALSRKERVKSRRVKGMILAAQSEWYMQEKIRRTINLETRIGSHIEMVDLPGGFECCLASSSGWTKSPVLWAEIGESSLTRLGLVQEMTDKVVLVKEKPKAARDRQKSYVDYRRKPLEFEVGNHVLLKVTPWKGVVHYGKKGKINTEICRTKCLADANFHVPLDEIKVDKTLRFVEEPVEIMDQEI